MMWRIFQTARTMELRAPRHILKCALFCVADSGGSGGGGWGGGGRIISRSDVTWAHKNNTNAGVDNNLDIYQLHFLFVW